MKSADFVSLLQEHGSTTFYGVPDSLLKHFSSFLFDNYSDKQHIITPNEGHAIAMACGFYLANSECAVVYLQNSGLGNCINPILSLADSEVYSIPFLMLIGWRGEPGIQDEPQHYTQGRVTKKMLDSMGIMSKTLPSNIDEAKRVVHDAYDYMSEFKRPFALLVSQNSFLPYVQKKESHIKYTLSKADVMALLLAETSEDDIIVATTGHIARELYAYRESRGESHDADFLCIGGMGYASSVALSIAIQKPNKRVICLDGDGACLMHMGALAMIASNKINNLKHIVFNNEAHDSVGGQPTCADVVNLADVAKACGYFNTSVVCNETSLKLYLPDFLSSNKMEFLEIKIKRVQAKT